MKKKLIYRLISFMFTLTTGAQEQQKFSPEKFDAELQEFITAQAKLTPQEATKFFPIYKEMQGKQRATRMSIESTFRVLKDNNFVDALTEIPVKNLTPEYIPHNSLSAQQIIESYNPLSDTEKLKASPHDFERLRADYQYRNEPLE